MPTFDEEIYQKDRLGDGRDWHTIEGPFWFSYDGWQYLMYSGACYGNSSYHIGYASAKDADADLTKIDFIKHTESGRFSPLMIKDENEEGTGHNYVLEYKDQLYVVYHGRDYKKAEVDGRTARICKLFAENGELRIEKL